MHTLSKPFRSALNVLALLAAVTLSDPSSAQCGVSQIDTGVENNRIWKLALWDPDGPGPESSELVVSGEFSRVGDINTRNIALYDLDTQRWEAIGNGLPNAPAALSVLPNGRLIACGRFDMGGNPVANYPIVQWEGDRWSPIGTEFLSEQPYSQCSFCLPARFLQLAAPLVFDGGTAQHGMS